jgi:hypothetical protein
VLQRSETQCVLQATLCACSLKLRAPNTGATAQFWLLSCVRPAGPNYKKLRLQQQYNNNNNNNNNNKQDAVGNPLLNSVSCQGKSNKVLREDKDIPSLNKIQLQAGASR